MKLYLVRHGEATTDLEDPRRPLSAAGRAEVERVAKHLASRSQIGAGLTVRHSGKLRAAQTAEVICSHLKGVPPPMVLAGIAPNDPPDAALELIRESPRDLMLVGHLPHLGMLASHLLAGNAERSIVAFGPCTVACLSGSPGGWVLEWLLTTDLAAR